MLTALALSIVALGGAAGTSTVVRGDSNESVAVEAAELSAGSYVGCALIGDGTARCWGANTVGQLGNGTLIRGLTPTPVSGLTNAVAISTGAGHSCVLADDSTLHCWGRNFYGELGDGTFNNKAVTPVTVALSDVVAVSAGAQSTCALLADTTARCWGYNSRGQLGNGAVNLTANPTPTPVSGLSGAVAISTGNEHSCALLSDGTVSCWGENGGGRLGDGTQTDRLTPVTVSGLSGAIAISAGGQHTCALLGDGTARCWGINTSGQLGDGTTTRSFTAVTVLGLADAVGISAGDQHTCAVLVDGTGRCWGFNSDGRLGNGTTTNALTPATVADLSEAVAITSGNTFSCALLDVGTLRCWGQGLDGQLGDGTASNSSVPVTVVGFQQQQNTCATLDPSGLIGRWAGEDPAAEGLTGTVATGTGQVGSAMVFDGTNTATASFPGVTNAVTVEMWIKPTTTGTTQVLISQWTMLGGRHDDAFALTINPYGDLEWLTDGPTGRLPDRARVTGPNLFDGQWHHVAATWTPTNVAVYIDGTPELQRPAKEPQLNNVTTEFRIGSSTGRGNPFWYHGSLDEPSIWNRALTPTDIAAIHTAGPAGKC